MKFHIVSQISSGGNWLGATDKYVGLKFNISGKNHYGWVRFTVAADAGAFTVKDYAYESIADSAITAGDTAVLTSLKPVAKQNISVYSFGNKVHINLADQNSFNSNLEIIDLDGKQVYTGKLRQRDNLIQVDGIVTGIYLVRIESAEGTFVKRLFLQAIK
ncbi:MAG: T9SS type A sorting domain-containing protein [Bacteroidetes bacterium]|nr:T9SS type A sorting domain-containing protein [Bacteroidota bacterium]